MSKYYQVTLLFVYSIKILELDKRSKFESKIEHNSHLKGQSELFRSSFCIELFITVTAKMDSSVW